MLVNELNDKLNISYLHELRAKISDIKKSIDSDAFKYL